MTKRKDWLEPLLYWSMLFALGVFVVLLIMGLIIRPWLPEEVAFVLGFGLFFLLANRLFFGYGGLSDYLDKIARDAVSEDDRQKAFEKSGARKHGLIEQLSHYGIATIWLERYEPYRYAYLGLYLLLTALVLALNLNWISGLTTGSVLEGLFWGATVVSVFVLAADSIVRWQYARVAAEPVFAALAQSVSVAEAAEKQAPDPACPEPDDCAPSSTEAGSTAAKQADADSKQ